MQRRDIEEGKEMEGVPVWGEGRQFVILDSLAKDLTKEMTFE